MSVEKYLRPEVIRQVSRLDLRAKFIVQGFLTGLHSSPFHGFSVEFSEHRKYTPGDDLKTLDWSVYAKTGKYFVKKYQAETNMTGYLVIDLSKSMDWNGPAEARRAGVKLDRTVLGAADETLTVFDYAVSLAAALGYLMILQQDPVGLVAFDTKLRTVVPPKSKRSQLGTLLSVLANLKATGATDVAASLTQFAPMIKGKSLVMLFSDLLPTTDDWKAEADAMIRSLYRLRYAGHEVIVFHVLDVVAAKLPLASPLVQFEDVESPEEIELDPRSIQESYVEGIREFRDYLKTECTAANVDYLGLDTSVGFDKALIEYLVQRQRRFS